MSQLGTDIHGFLGKLLKDRAGNTLAIVAASTIPLMALIGGGVDISRGYMAKTQLQAACDAGVLAGRRAMAKSGEYSTKERAKANAMFNFNFDKASVQADGSKTKFDTQDNDEGQVTGTASTEMPTSVMYLFGKDTMDLAVDCMAELQLANVDIMFVLDNTGSMLCLPSEKSCSVSTERPGAKIVGLRAAVRSFHSTIASAVLDDETRVRYAFVPYSSSVNVSKLLADGDMPSNFIADKAYYQTRSALFDKKVYVGKPGSPVTGANETSTGITSSACDTWVAATTSSGTAPSNTTVTTYTKVSWTKTSGSGSSAKGTCIRKPSTTTTTYDTQYTFTKWRYDRRLLDTSKYKTGANVSLVSDLKDPYDGALGVTNARVNTSDYYNTYDLGTKTGVAGSGVTGVVTKTARWKGCIEERATTSNTTTSFNPIPSDALDLNLTDAPDPGNPDTQWKPLWPSVEYARGTNYASWETTTAVVPSNSYHSSVVESCPQPMRLFEDVDLTGGTNPPDWLNTYLDSLSAAGNTYLDLGLIWGGRLGSTRGIFEENVNEGDENISVSRHLIFMTDGEMDPSLTVYSAYGLEQLDARVAPLKSSDATLTTRHNLRFRAACDAVKAEGYTIYVVAFGAGSSITPDMTYCSSGGRAYYSSDTTQLNNTFKFIASQVADLRLGK